MKVAIGIDMIDIKRFNEWNKYSLRALTRIYTQNEIEYCLSVPAKMAERFAARFAAKEALYKAVCQLYGATSCSFAHLVKNSAVVRTSGAPLLKVEWEALGLPDAQALLSLSHTHFSAVAQVMIIAY